jgi:hypothetical protein
MKTSGQNLRIRLDDLRPLWQSDPRYGAWRVRLRTGYRPDEPYFEFGVMRELNAQACEYRVVLDHEVPVYLCRSMPPKQYEWMIVVDDAHAGQSESPGLGDFTLHTLFVSGSDYEQLRRDAEEIIRDYGDEEIVSFWSIPNKWFGDTQLVHLLDERVVSTRDYQERPRSRHTWYWP